MALDWLATVSTGVVGVVGIIGSTWAATTARRSQYDLTALQLATEDRRTDRADKRAFYTRALSHSETLAAAAFDLFTLERAIEKLHQQHNGAPVEEWEPAQAAALVKRLDQVRKALLRQGELNSEMRRLRSEGAIVGGPVIGDAINATFESTTQIHLAGNRRPFWDAVQRMAMTMHTDLQSVGRPQISRPGRTARRLRNPMMARRRRLVPTHRAVPDPRQAQSGLDTPTADAATDNV